jgi:hypothetical protein
MPTNHRCRLHDNKRAAPIEQPSQDGQADSSRSIYRSRLDAALDVQRQLTAQEEVLGLDRFGRTEQQHHPAQGVFDQAECNPDEGDHALIVPQRSVLNLPRKSSAAPNGTLAEDSRAATSDSTYATLCERLRATPQ